MANLHYLAAQPSILRLRNAETLVAATTDGTNARADAIGRLDRLSGALDNERLLIAAVDLRLTRRPPVAAPTSLQDLMRAGRRRLDRERLGGRRTWHRLQLDAVTRLRGVLES